MEALDHGMKSQGTQTQPQISANKIDPHAVKNSAEADTLRDLMGYANPNPNIEECMRGDDGFSFQHSFIFSTRFDSHCVVALFCISPLFLACKVH